MVKKRFTPKIAIENLAILQAGDFIISERSIPIFVACQSPIKTSSIETLEDKLGDKFMGVSPIKAFGDRF